MQAEIFRRQSKQFNLEQFEAAAKNLESQNVNGLLNPDDDGLLSNSDD